MKVVIGLPFVLLVLILLVEPPQGEHLVSHQETTSKEQAEHHSTNRVRKASGNSTFNQGKCLLCKILVKHGMKKMKTSENVTSVLNVVERMCVLLRLETSQVCKGGIETFGEQVSLVLKQVDLSPEDVCYLAFPDKCLVSVLTGAVSPKWKVNLPKPSATSQKGCRSYGYTQRKPLKVLHLTDVHVDFLYDLEGKVQCRKPVCCRSGVKSKKRQRDGGGWSSRAITIMSKFFPSQGPDKEQDDGVGRWGDYRRCDLPLWTMENLFATIDNGSKNNASSNNFLHLGKIDYVILTGDLTSHDVWAQTKRGQLSMLEKLNVIIKKYFPDTKIFPSPGNHDSYPPNNYPPTNVASLKDMADPWIYQALAKLWRDWLPDEALETVRAGAFYTVLVYPGFRIISLNTNFCYAENWWIYLSPEDPGGMLKWFVQILTQAEKAGEKVHVIGHVPPGRSPDCLEGWSENYYRVLERFRCTITGQFFGHTHFDEVGVFYGQRDPNKPFAVSYIAPSVTPYVGMNPAFRIYDVDGLRRRSSWRVVNHHTYIMDLEDANQSGVPKWKIEYDALSAFNLSSLEPEDWGRLVLSWRNYFDSGAAGSPPGSLIKYMTFYSRRRLVDSGEGARPRGSSHDANLPCKSMKCAVKVICRILKNSDWDMCAI